MRLRDSVWFKVILLVVVLLCWLLWAAPASCRIRVGSSAEGQRLELGSASSITINAPANSIAVRRSSEVSQITAISSGTGRSFDRLSSSRSGDSLNISMTGDSARWWKFWKIGLGSRRLEVLVPMGMKLDSLSVTSYSGAVQIDSFDIARELAVASLSGSIRLDSMSAEKVSISNVSGLVSVQALKADSAEINNTSGLVSIDMFEGGRLVLNTVSGSIDIYDTGEFESMSLGSISGSIEVDFGSSRAPSVTASTTSGGIEIYGAEYQRNAYVKGNGPDVTVTNVSGSIEIEN
ncbi:MAG: DUF4097 family beta strand repeat-containing protein [Sphaerochaetaceae bacterium]